MSGSVERIPIKKFLNRPGSRHESRAETDEVATEDPLEIRLLHVSGADGSLHQTRSRIAVTMRTPGHDLELAAGFLFSESILKSPDEILGHRTSDNRIELTLAADLRLEPERLQKRLFYVTSSCGICGKSSIEDIWEKTRYCDWNAPGSGPFVSAKRIADLPNRLRSAQTGFSRTGGTHASGLFSITGDLLLAREDVGRHNALDKVIGRAFLDGKLPLDQTVLALSGRVSFELMQKAAMAGIRIIVAVGAPSSLAVQIAQEFDLTLIGFVREDRFNIYHGDWRITDTLDPGL